MPQGSEIGFSRRLRCTFVVVVFSLWFSFPVRAAPPTDADAMQALVEQVQSMVTGFAAQRDAAGGWPNNVDMAYQALMQAAAQLDTARSSNNYRVARRAYRAAMRAAGRVTRWLAIHYAPENDDVPSRDRATAIIERLNGRVDLLVGLASQAGVTLNLDDVNAARAQVTTALSDGTNVALRNAIRSLRDAIDSLQSALPDAEM